MGLIVKKIFKKKHGGTKGSLTVVMEYQQLFEQFLHGLSMCGTAVE